MEPLELKTLGMFDTIAELKAALHKVHLQVNNEFYSHFHTARDEELFGKILEYIGPADAMLDMMIDNDYNIRKLD